MSVDPLFEMFPEHSPYQYAYNSPLIWSDPSGMFPEIQMFIDGYRVYNSVGVTITAPRYEYIESDDDEDTRTGSGGGAAGASGIPQWMQDASARSEGHYWMSLYEWCASSYSTNYSTPGVTNRKNYSYGPSNGQGQALPYYYNGNFVDAPKEQKEKQEVSKNSEVAINYSIGDIIMYNINNYLPIWNNCYFASIEFNKGNIGTGFVYFGFGLIDGITFGKLYQGMSILRMSKGITTNVIKYSTRIQARNLKDFKSLIKKLSNPNSKLTKQELRAFEKLAKKFKAKIRYDLNPTQGKILKPHIQVEGLGKSIESRHIWLREGVR